jgi:hypothetical protein
LAFVKFINISKAEKEIQNNVFKIYLDITTDDKRQALATLEGEKEKNVTKKWKDSSGSLADFCGLKR